MSESSPPINRMFSQSRTRSLTVTAAILVFELCERLTYNSIVANLVMYCKEYLEISSVDAIKISLSFTGVVYFLPLFGGFLADTYIGRFNTIYLCGMIYFIGAMLLTVVPFDFGSYLGLESAMSLVSKRSFFAIGLLMIAVGTGGIKSNVSPFGASQMEGQGKAAVRSFFNWFYWFINLGSSVAFTLVVYIQQTYSFFYGFLIPTISIFIACSVFYIPKNSYVHEEPEGSAFTNVFRIIRMALRRRMSYNLHYRSVLDYARLSYGGSFEDSEVENVRKIFRILPVFACIIPFWLIYYQMQSTFLVQGECMDLRLGNFPIPVASLNLANTVVILIGTPLVDRCLYPILKRCCNYVPTHLHRIGFGMVLTALSVLIAGGLEISRKNDIRMNGGFPQEILDHTYTASNISIMAQVPQFLCVGLGEIFTSISGLEFAFSESPEKLKSVVMGLFLITSGLGSFLGTALVSLVNINPKDNWIPDDINSGHLEYFFFLLCGLMVLTLGIYILVARWYARTFSKPSEEVTFDYSRQTNKLEVDLT